MAFDPMAWSWAHEQAAWSMTQALARLLGVDADALGRVIVAFTQGEWDKQPVQVCAADLCGPCRCRLTHTQPCYCERDE